MPQVGWINEGVRFSFDEVEQITQAAGDFAGLPLPVLRKLESNERKPHVISPSMAGGCWRRAQLEREEDYYLIAVDRWQAMWGTAFHLLMAEDGERDVEKEVRLELEVGHFDDGTPIVLSGQTDRMEDHGDGTGEILDYKSTGSLWGKDKPNPQYILQQNLYRYLWWKVRGIDIQRIQLYYAVPVPKRKTERGIKKKVIEQMRVEIPIWPFEQIELMVAQLVEQVQQVRRGILPPPFEQGDSNYWLCGFCPVRAACERRAVAEAWA